MRLRRFAGSLAHSLPSVVDVAELVGRGARSTRTLPPREVSLVRPEGLSLSDWRAMQARDVGSVPEQFVLELPRATVLGRDGWVQWGGSVVSGVWQEAGFPVRRMVPHGTPAEPVHLAGTTASLLMPWLPNYYHWTTQNVPRVQMVREVVGDDVDQWLVPAGAPRYVGEWLDLLGIPVDRRVEVSSRLQTFTTDRLVVSSIPGRNRWVPPAVVDVLRSHFEPPARTGRRIFIQRSSQDRRHIVNEDEVADALDQHGFEAVDVSRLPVQEEAALFGSASVVVGVHGAGLTNLVYCPPGASVVELTPRALIYPTFLKLAVAAGIQHRFVLGEEPGLPWPLRFPDVLADVIVDVSALRSILEGLLSGVV